jgi:hypothetical protein
MLRLRDRWGSPGPGHGRGEERDGAEASGSVYAGIIARLAPDDDPEDIVARLVAEHGSLDSIDPVRFACAVKRAAEHGRPTGACDDAQAGA